MEGAGRDRSMESESHSEPEVGVSLARIGLPLSYPDNPENCSCDRNHLLSDSDDKQSKFEIFFLKYFDVATLLVYNFVLFIIFDFLRQEVLLPCFPPRPS